MNKLVSTKLPQTSDNCLIHFLVAFEKFGAAIKMHAVYMTSKIQIFILIYYACIVEIGYFLILIYSPSVIKG